MERERAKTRDKWMNFEERNKLNFFRMDRSNPLKDTSTAWIQAITCSEKLPLSADVEDEEDEEEGSKKTTKTLFSPWMLVAKEQGKRNAISHSLANSKSVCLRVLCLVPFSL